MADESKTLAWKLVVNTEGIEKNTAQAASALKSLAAEAKLAGAAIGAIMSSRLLRGALDFADGMTRMSNQIQLVTRNADEAALVQEKLRAAAMATGTPLESTVANYQKFAQSLDGYGLSVEQVIRVQETATKMLKLYGSNAENVDAQVKSLALAFNQGSLSQMQFGRLLKDMPKLADALADATKRPKEELLKLVADGKFTGKMLLDALGGAADDIDAKWKARAPTFAGSFNALRTQVQIFLEDFEKATGFFGWLAEELRKFTKEEMPVLLDMFRRLGATIKEEFQIAQIVVKGAFENIVNLVQYLSAAADEPFSILAARIKAGFLLTVNDVRTIFAVLVATVQEWVAKVAATLVGLIPDFATKYSKDLKDFKDHYSKIDEVSKGAVEAAKADGAAREMIINSNMKSEIAYAQNKTRVAKTTYETTKDYWQAELKAAQETATQRREIDKLLTPVVVTAQRKRAGAGERPGKDPKEKGGVDELTKAMQALNNEYDKIRDNAQLTAYEIANGTEAMKDYKIALDMRRATEEKIAAMQATKRGITQTEAQGLRDLTERNITAAQAQRYFADSSALVKGAIEAGKTPMEKANEEIAKLQRAFESTPAGIEYSAEAVAAFNRRLEELKKAADPAQDALDKLKDQSKMLDIQYKALQVSLTQGSTAASIYTAAATNQMAMEKQLQELTKQGVAVGSERYNQVKAEIETNNRRTVGLIAEGEQRKALLDTVNAGTSSTAAAAKQADLAAEAFRKYNKEMSPQQIEQYNAGMRRLAVAMDPLRQKFEDAALQMGDSFVNFIMDANQSFQDFVVNTIKGIGQMIAQFYMMKAIKLALGIPMEKGGVIEHGNILPFQHGGVVSAPTTFPLRGGRGLMGEAGPEAIMPLARLPGGDLGVKSQPLNIELVNNTGVNATARVLQEADRTQLILEAAELGATMAQSRFNSSVSSGYGASATNMQRTYGLTRRKA